MSRIVASIPVHEQPAVVLDQIRNFRKYNPDMTVVVHISRDLANGEELAEAILREGACVNPERLDTGWGNILWAHISNFRYMQRRMAFDYFVLHSSNDLYILPGAGEYLSGFDAGFHIHRIAGRSRWWPGNQAMEDRQLKELMRLCGTDEIVATQIEGSFYRSTLMEQIASAVEQSREREDRGLRYTREEVYLSTAAYALTDHARIGDPVVWSEVHRFDRRLWLTQWLTWGIYHRSGLMHLIDRKRYDRFEKICGERIARRAGLTIGDVRRLVKSGGRPRRREQYLCDGVSRYRLYGERIYAVKRVARDMADPVRQYINDLA